MKVGLWNIVLEGCTLREREQHARRGERWIRKYSIRKAGMGGVKTLTAQRILEEKRKSQTIQMLRRKLYVDKVRRTIYQLTPERRT